MRKNHLFAFLYFCIDLRVLRDIPLNYLGQIETYDDRPLSCVVVLDWSDQNQIVGSVNKQCALLQCQSAS